jgi:predicted DNA binding CopG/RHH family protein
MNKKRKVKKLPTFLDDEEKNILKSFEKAEWRSVSNVETRKAILKQAASNYLKKDNRINIRISSSDLSRLKQLAAYEGLPYQTLIASVLHKFASGYLHMNQQGQ